jgi:hypothetical protein
MPEQAIESPFQAILFDEPLQIAVLAASEIQELAIRAGGVLIDGPMGQGQEVALALFEASAKDGPSFVKAHWMPQERWEADEEPDADADLLQHARARKLQVFSPARTIGH